MDEQEEAHPPSVAKLSKTPSWVMLGFLLGVLFVLFLPRKAAPPAAVVPSPVAVTVGRTPPTVERALFFEGVFAEWNKYAVWENDLTEVAFWNSDTKSFSDRFEVMRSGDRAYFRSILNFTRPVMTHGIPDNSPLQFTETQAMREEWLKENSAENIRQFLAPPNQVTPRFAPAPGVGPRIVPDRINKE
jgi:hypothetical protein